MQQVTVNMCHGVEGPETHVSAGLTCQLQETSAIDHLGRPKTVDNLPCTHPIHNNFRVDESPSLGSIRVLPGRTREVPNEHFQKEVEVVVARCHLPPLHLPGQRNVVRRPLLRVDQRLVRLLHGLETLPHEHLPIVTYIRRYGAWTNLPPCSGSDPIFDIRTKKRSCCRCEKILNHN